MEKSRYFIVLVLLSVLLLNGCSDKPGEQLLLSKTWILSSYGLRDNKKHKLMEGMHYYLNFYEYPGFATWNTSCPAQDIIGKYKINVLGKLFIIDCSAHTTQRCPDDDGSRRYRESHDLIYRVISGSSINIRENELVLTSSDDEQLIFTGVTNGQRMNFFEQLLAGFFVMLHSCGKSIYLLKYQTAQDNLLLAFMYNQGQA